MLKYLHSKKFDYFQKAYKEKPARKSKMPGKIVFAVDAYRKRDINLSKKPQRKIQS